MAITPVTVTFKLVDFLGYVPDIRRTKVLLDTNVDSGFLVDTTTGGSFRIADATVTIDSTGLASFSVLPSGATGLNPSAYQIRVRIDAANPVTRQREKVDLGWYTITAAADLKDLVAAQYVPPTYLSSVTATLDTKVAAAEAARDAAVDISNISTSDAVVEALVKNTGGAGPLTSGALSATIAAEMSAPEAIADGLSHPLSASFATLAEAQARFPAATALTDEWDWAAIMSRIQERGWCYLPGTTGGYVINKPLVADVLWGDKDRTLVTQTGTNMPIVDATGGVRLSYLTLTYQTAQTSAHTASNGIQLTNVLMGSSLKCLSVRKAARGIYNVAPGYVFSTTFQDIDINGFAITGFDVTNAGGITGNVISNMYVHNNPTGTAAVSTEAPVKIGGWYEGTISQLNIEDCIAPRGITFNTNRHLTLNSVHFERFTMTGTFGGLIEFNNYTSRALFSGLTVLDCNFLAANISSGLSSLFKVTDGTQVIIYGFDASENTVDIGQLALVYASGITGTRATRVTFEDSTRGEFTLDQIGDASTVPIVAAYNGYDIAQPDPLSAPLKAALYYASFTATGTSTAILPEASMRGGRLIVGRDCTLNQIGCEVTVAGTVGAVVRLGVYKLNPSTHALTLLVDAGTVDATTTGAKTLTISQAVSRGDHLFLVAVPQGVAATRPTLRINGGIDPLLASTDAATALGTPLGGIAISSVSGALPSAPTIAVAGITGVPKVVVRAT